jgi:sulfatase maturation enzyme AslB (radical SAM superfamily)
MKYAKFESPKITAKGETRAHVPFTKLKTLWLNSGTLCNLACKNCYIESSPINDRLVYLSAAETKVYLDEIKSEKLETKNIGITGGEPFINPEIISILELCLAQGHETLVLTNAHKILKRHHKSLIKLKDTYRDKLKLRISLDHYTKEIHEIERGEDTFESALNEIKWLFDEGFNISIAGRSLADEDMDEALLGYQELVEKFGINIKLKSENKIVIFPEMKLTENVPEITTACWGILGKSPHDQMCSTERMIVKRKGSDKPVVMACTLLAYDEQFELGHTLKESMVSVSLNHVFCAKFCVLGGASCSSTN